MRTDDHNNPTAFTTDLAKEAGLVEGIDYTQGAPFTVTVSDRETATLYTAKLLGDPLAVTIKVIDAVGFYTRSGAQRWSYTATPKIAWDELSPETQRDIIGLMYQREGGTAMIPLFPNYGKVHW